MNEIEQYKRDARNKMEQNQDEYWLYWYEALSSSDLSDNWKILKNHKISFISWENVEEIES